MTLQCSIEGGSGPCSCEKVPLHPIRYVVAFVVRIQTCILIDIYRVAFDDNHVAIDPYCIAINILYSVQCFSVPEFDEEIEGVVYKRRRVLTTLALTTEGAYSVQHEDPVIYSDDEEECQFERPGLIYNFPRHQFLLL